MEILTFAEFWNRTEKTGRKEVMAKRWFYLPTALKQTITERLSKIKGNININDYLK